MESLKPGQIAVVILPYSGNRYLSKVFDDNWMIENKHVHDPEETIAPIVDLNVLTANPESSVESLLPVFARAKVVVVREESRSIEC